jgi:hypothetical protein
MKTIAMIPTANSKINVIKNKADHTLCSVKEKNFSFFDTSEDLNSCNFNLCKTTGKAMLHPKKGKAIMIVKPITNQTLAPV